MKPVIAASMVVTNALGTLAVYAQTDNPIPRSWTTDGTLAGQLIILLTTLGGFAYTIYRENRNRRWDMEDREAARKELADNVVAARLEQIRHAEEAKREIVRKIDENTLISSEALATGNDHNRKITDIMKMFMEVKSTARDAAVVAAEKSLEGTKNTLDRVDGNAQEAVERLRKIDDEPTHLTTRNS